MEDVKDVKGDAGLAQDGKPEGGETGEVSDHNELNSGGPKEMEDHRECKLEKQEDIHGMEEGEEKNETREEAEANVREDAVLVKCKATPQRMEDTVVGDKLEVVEDLEAQNDVEYEVKLEKPKDVKHADKIEGEDADDLGDSHCQGNGRNEEQEKEVGIMMQVEEKSKKELAGSDELDKTEDVNNMMVKANSHDGVDDEEDKAENFEKKYKGKKHSEKWRGKRGIDATGYTHDVKGEARKSESEVPTDELDHTEQLEDEEHDVEGTEPEKIEKQYVKDDEGVLLDDELSADKVKRKCDEDAKVEEEAESEDGDSEDDEEAVVYSDDEEKESKRKLFPRKRDRVNGEKVKNGRKTLQEEPTTPGFLADRPVRERKSVVRLVEVIEKEQGEGLRIEKGRGIPLKDIPNVVYKLSKRKPEDIKLLHLILFGRKGKATDFKSHISQFSGFVWPENEEKQKAKVKEKIDKCARFKLLDFCDLFDITVSRATTKKEELVEKLLNFLIAPHPTIDVKSSEKEQHSSVKRKRSSGGSFSDTIDSSSSKPLKKRRTGTNFKDKDEKRDEEDKRRTGNGLLTKNEDSDHSASEKENDSIENVNSEDFNYAKKKESKREKNRSAKKSPSLKKMSSLSSGSGAQKSASKQTKAEETGRTGNGLLTRNEDSDHSTSERENDSIENVNSEDFNYAKKKDSKREKNRSAKKSPPLKMMPPLSSRSGAKRSASKETKMEETHDSGPKMSASKHTKVEETHDSGPKMSASEHTKVEETHNSGPKVPPSKHSKVDETHDSGPKVFSRRKKADDTPKKQSTKLESRVKDIGRKLGTSKLKSDKTEPNKDELRKMISVILKEVDFNTATFKDILRQLGTRFKTDLTHMKEEIKLMTKEELVKIAEEEANSDDDEEASDDEENVPPTAKKLRT